MQLDDQTFLERFAARDLGPEYFDHRGHLRMAWLHLVNYSLDEAIDRVCKGIRDLAGKFGAPEKYNRTLTEALMRIMAARMNAAPASGFEGFLQHNTDLLQDAQDVLARYYSATRLSSEQARCSWLAPDLAPFDS
jgi:hypothetical protein